MVLNNECLIKCNGVVSGLMHLLSTWPLLRVTLRLGQGPQCHCTIQLPSTRYYMQMSCFPCRHAAIKWPGASNAWIQTFKYMYLCTVCSGCDLSRVIFRSQSDPVTIVYRIKDKFHTVLELILDDSVFHYHANCFSDWSCNAKKYMP